MLENLVTTAEDGSHDALGLPLVALLGQSRAAIVDYLLQHRQARLSELANELGVSETATRRHVAQLEDDGFVIGETLSDGPGRPAWHFRLTPAGHELFPQRYAAVADELMTFVQSTYGDAGLDAYLDWRRERQTETFGGELSGETTGDRLDDLAAALSAAGYAAHVTRATAGGGYELTQQHCAIAHLAAAHPELCASETQAFAALLGAEVSVTRTLTIAGGHDACVCTVNPIPDATSSPTKTPDFPTDAPDDHASEEQR